jgi:stage II sporulation protein D
MVKLKLLFILFLASFAVLASGQVKVRLFANQFPESAIFSVTKGEYELNPFNRRVLKINTGEPVLVLKYNGKVVVKVRNEEAFICDSLILTGKTGNDYFSLKMNQKYSSKQYYSDDLKCLPDFNTLVFINTTDVEKYISGVVLTEGGPGKSLEFYKTQAIIARTYMYKYFDRHSDDGFNVCDNTHCQAFNGLSSDSLLNIAVMQTSGLVIIDKDSMLIMSAFHSNCGGETSSAGDVWLTHQPYLKSVTDPYCTSSRNATWQKSIPVSEWLNYIRKSGGNNLTDEKPALNFVQTSRVPDYKTASFTIPLRTIRSDFNLRSTFFSVYANGDSVILKGKGYGHGVGLCQEGAMTMASRGFNYKQIINFYFSGVFITDIKNVKLLPAYR